MRRISNILFFVCAFFVFAGYSQNNGKGFYLINNGIVPQSEIEKYERAISNANLEMFRFKTTQDTLEFVNGLKFVLFSAQQMFISGMMINNIESYKDKIDNYRMPKFVLLEDGRLLAVYEHNKIK